MDKKVKDDGVIEGIEYPCLLIHSVSDVIILATGPDVGTVVSCKNAPNRVGEWSDCWYCGWVGGLEPYDGTVTLGSVNNKKG